MKTQTKKMKNKSTPINSGDCCSHPVPVMSIQSAVTSSDELQGIILPMRLLLQMKQRTGSRLVAQVSISIFRESTKTDYHTASCGMQPSGTYPTNAERRYVQATLPLMYPISSRKQKPCASNSSATHSPKLSSSPGRKQPKLPSQSQAKAKKSI